MNNGVYQQEDMISTWMIFFHNIIPGVANSKMNLDNYIYLGNIDPSRFMNVFIEIIKDIDKERPLIFLDNEEKIECEVEFLQEEDNEEEEMILN